MTTPSALTLTLQGSTDALETPTAARRPDSSWSDEELFRALKTATPAGRERIQDLLVRRHAGLVRWLAGSYSSTGVDQDELRQVGYLGLVLAIQRFDVERGRDFIGYARPTVQGEIRRYFRDKRRWIRLPRRLQEAKATLRKSGEFLFHELGREATVEELAAHAHLSVETVSEALAADDTFTLACLDAPLSNDGDDSFTVADTVGDPDPRIDRFMDRDELRPLLQNLPERERRILHLCFFEEKTQAQIGRELGVSQMQISRLLNRTLATLRSSLTAA
jgi:RNA polymerase sigma-B factor